MGRCVALCPVLCNCAANACTTAQYHHKQAPTGKHTVSNVYRLFPTQQLGFSSRQQLVVAPCTVSFTLCKPPQNTPCLGGGGTTNHGCVPHTSQSSKHQQPQKYKLVQSGHSYPCGHTTQSFQLKTATKYTAQLLRQHTILYTTPSDCYTTHKPWISHLLDRSLPQHTAPCLPQGGKAKQKPHSLLQPTTGTPKLRALAACS